MSFHTVVLTGGPCGGKAQPVNSLVLTPSGLFREIGSIKPGDLVVSAEGPTVAVKAVYPQGVKKVYRMTFEDGRCVRCTADHLWKVWTHTSVWDPARKKKVRARDWRVVPLSYILERKQGQKVEHQRMAIPLYTPDVAEQNVQFEFDPYLVGLLLGDGGLSGCSPILTTADDYIVKQASAHVAAASLRMVNVTCNGEDTISWRISAKAGQPNPLIRWALKANLNVNSKQKFIPEPFFEAAFTQRLALLRGLLDTDGTVDKQGRVSFSSSSEQLAADVQRLAWSLGCIASCNINRPTYTYNGEKPKGAISYSVHIQYPKDWQPFALPRKLARCNPHQRRCAENRLRISSVEEDGEAECVCISIDSASGLYVTDNYVVTHNTTALSHIEDRLTSLGVRTIVVPEAATIIFGGGARPDFSNPQACITFQTQLLRLQLALEKSFRSVADTFRDEKIVMLCDRGAMDAKAFVDPVHWQAILDENEWTEVGLRDRFYDAVIHLVTAANGAEEFYTLENNPARTEGPEHARSIDSKLQEAWTGHPHLRVINNDVPDFATKVRNAVDAVCRAVGVPAPTEIERKFLVRTVDTPFPVHANVCDIEQQYLLSESDKEVGRIRRRGVRGSYVYTHTLKGPTQNGERIEIERTINAREYVDFLNQVDPTLKPIQKFRTCFLWKDRYFELDQFVSPHEGLMLLEVELNDINEEVELPPFIHIEREVTSEKAYSNRALAGVS